ncbi:MAG: hypothetical protein AB9835_08040 [Eubacteriales bacterium]
MDYAGLIQSLPQPAASLVTPLHKIALEKGCTYRVDGTAQDAAIHYSLRGYNIRIKDGAVSFSGEYDIRAFLRLYRECGDTVRSLLFDAAESCSLCINDKCTTFLMEEQRTIEFNGRSKKLCGPYRHWVTIPVTEDTLYTCLSVASMLFEYTHPHQHRDLFASNEVSYEITYKDTLYLTGYMARHNSLSRSDLDHVRDVLSDPSRTGALQEIGGEGAKFVGAIDKFENGNNYEFIFGVLTDKKPAVLPEKAVCRKIRSGEWAVYNSSARDYKSIWRSFSADFYGKEGKGYDTSRIPFEYYDADGNAYNVHIPVDADMPRDSDRSVTMLFLPTLLVAGYPIMSENDHPEYRDYPFDLGKRLSESFPYADKIYGMALHSFFGKPIQHGCYYAYDDLTPVPEDMERRELKAGWFLVEGWRHFNGGYSDYPFDKPMNFRIAVDDMHHPGLWLDIEYTAARGGYKELCNPAHIKGRRSFEVVELESLRVYGLLEAPPYSVVTEKSFADMYSLPVNAQSGCRYIGYTITVPEGKGMYFDKPLIKGIAVREDGEVPCDWRALELEGGKYVRVSEDNLNGEPGWEIEYMDVIERETGHKVDTSRQFRIKQNDFGRSYEWFVPVL